LGQLPTLQQIRAEKARRLIEAERRRTLQNADAIRARCQTLAGFVREAWHVLEPRATYHHNWHIDAICAHLEAVTAGRINRLLINVPPGSMKSLLVSVLWQAWEWGPMGMRSLRYLTTAYNDTPVKRDTRKTRDLILSEWYQSLWPEVELTRTAEMSFANRGTGTREGVAFGSLTSQRGDRLILDDPHSSEKAESAVERANTTRKFREGAQDRINDLEKSAIVVIMQRLHEDDVSGTILKLGMDYTHLMLPMEFEIDRASATSIGFSDPRSSDGDLLDPHRFPREAIESLKIGMTSYAYAGQYQQRPAPREGGMFKRHWFADKIIGAAPAGTKWVRHWDLAATAKKTAARTAGVKLGKTPDGRYVVGHVVKIQQEGNAVRSIIKATAQTDGKDCMISLPQDPGQAGKVQAADMIAMLAGYVARAEPESGDKVTRAEPFACQCEAENVYLVKGEWNESYLDELCLFPGATFKDQVDASSGAFGRLVNTPQEIDIGSPVQVASGL
jgi:predicted phage terminase large subunit-like protein